MSLHLASPRRGFSLIEALISLLIVSFGMLALVGVNLKLSRSEDVARQRSEAVRLAQQKIEEMRSFTQIAAAGGVLSWDGLASGSDTLANSADYATNTSFVRNWRLLGAASDPMRNLTVSIAWTDRSNETQSISYATVLAKSDPTDAGSLGFPLPGNTMLKQPKNRSINIPVPALDLGNGKSAFQLVSNFAIVFSNESGYVVQTCNKQVNNAGDLSSGCTETSAYIVAGYISASGGGSGNSGSSSLPTGLAINTAQVTGSTGSTCAVSDAVNQNSGTAIAGYKYYLCVISVESQGMPWGGTLRLAAPALNFSATDYLVCRFQYPARTGVTSNMRNVQPYVSAAESLDAQNYLVTTANSCPTVDGLTTTLHQNCSLSASNPLRVVGCPSS